MRASAADYDAALARHFYADVPSFKEGYADESLDTLPINGPIRDALLAISSSYQTPCAVALLVLYGECLALSDTNKKPLNLKSDYAASSSGLVLLAIGDTGCGKENAIKLL